MDIKAKIDQMRKERKWTKSRLAREAGITPNTVYNWYNQNNAIPTRESIENVCFAFGITVASFYGDVDPDNLTEQEIQALEYFRKIPDKKKVLALSTLKAFCD